MSGMTMTHRIGVTSIAAAMALALGAGAATAARPAGMSQAEYTALMTRSAALNALYGNAVTRLSPAEFASLWRSGASRLEPQEFVALVERSQGLNRLGASGAFATPTESVRDGFHWGDFGIGAGGMFGLVLVIVGVLARYGRLKPIARTS